MTNQLEFPRIARGPSLIGSQDLIYWRQHHSKGLSTRKSPLVVGIGEECDPVSIHGDHTYILGTNHLCAPIEVFRSFCDPHCAPTRGLWSPPLPPQKSLRRSSADFPPNIDPRPGSRFSWIPSPILLSTQAPMQPDRTDSDASFPSTDDVAIHDAFAAAPRAVLAHVVDVHCHPTDSPTDATHAAVAESPIRLCAMATRQSDQALVAALARAHPDRVVPCFGYHPWFSHWISLDTPPKPKEEHYRALFLAPAPNSDHAAAFARLLPLLPEPLALADVLADLRANLAAFPHALLGEVGLDRVCRVPYARPAAPPFSASYATAPEDDDRPGARARSPSRRRAQLAVAVDLRRGASVHSVHAQAATRALLDRMKAAHGARWLAVSVDLHSCGMSAQTWSEISTLWSRGVGDAGERAVLLAMELSDIVLRGFEVAWRPTDAGAQHSLPLTDSNRAKAHPNAFLSLSTGINARSPAYRALAAACAPDRLLVESDYYDARHSGPYTWHMLRTVAAVKGWRVEDRWDYADADVEGANEKSEEER
ncbi:uncharacterized protein BXZ73DRAFT_80178 [Epithele typhae]|uniref:uncharacterized protein n=1 Tax=Epithele typhae TaxID=378194 RepID=UPI0020088310|nr:uncharacterized protein BXZ73DRAFT_80178 [Epithele typhae]KAH9920234.1 hypothetical protein BXZ73DRAFT_80178 [Epithele typhae]